MSAADAGRQQNDDAVRRIRAESAGRIEGQRRRRAFSSWCALATLAGGISLAALDEHEMRVSPPVAAVARRPPDVRVEMGPVTLTPPRPVPAIVPKKHRCYLWEDDLFEPSVRRCIAWTAGERLRRLHPGPRCGGSGRP